ncbi:MAG: DegQ family serine endoprotease [Opitutales bacterium]|nr:DegQ family serine endoprotease [Opitutales bacterium]MCH8541220.1 DegQ family serine endoprotease [Opitutales bacterium]
MKTVTIGLLSLLLGSALAVFFQSGNNLPLLQSASSGSGEVRILVQDQPAERKNPEIPSFAPMIREVNPSVVNIYTTRRVEIRGGRSPFDDPFFRRFFGEEFFPEQRRQEPRHREQQGLGSGVIVSTDGYILTNHHVIAQADEIRVKREDGKKEYVAEVIGSDEGTDLAVLKIDATDLPALTFANSDHLEVGDLVFAVGNPFGLGHTVTMGIVSALGRDDMRIVDYENFIQTDASINPGNSGGALVNGLGELVGINTAILSRTGGNLGIGFAVPSNLARNVMQSLIEHGEVVRGFLGVTLQEITPELAEAMDLPGTRGVLVTDVVPDSPADKAGLQQGDVIQQFDGKRMESPRQLRLAVGSALPDSEKSLELLREGETISLTVTLGILPEGEGPLGQLDDQPNGALSGINVKDLDEESRAEFQIPSQIQGALITEVDPDSRAAEAGLRPGMVIREINRQRINSAREAREIGRELKPEDRVLLLIFTGRGNQYLVLPGDS